MWRLERSRDGQLITADLVAVDSGWKGIAARTPALAGAALTALLSVASGASAQSAATGGYATTQAASANAGAQAAAPDSSHLPAFDWSSHHRECVRRLRDS